AGEVADRIPGTVARGVAVGGRGGPHAAALEHVPVRTRDRVVGDVCPSARVLVEPLNGADLAGTLAVGEPAEAGTFPMQRDTVGVADRVCVGGRATGRGTPFLAGDEPHYRFLLRCRRSSATCSCNRRETRAS